MDGLIEIDGVQLAYGRSGDGPPLVLLHGGSARRELWDEFTPLLEDAYRVYTPDLPGHGRSGRTPGRYDLETVADVVARFIREVAGGPAAVYGHSYGGHVALVLAARHRDVVELAIAGDAPLSRGAVCSVIDSSRDRLEAWRALAGRGETATEIAARLRQLSPDHADGPWLDRIAASLADHDPEFLAAILDRCEEVHRALDPLRLLPAIRCPLILLQGDAAAGGLLSDEEVELALRLVPTARVERVAGAGHGLQLEAPERVAELIRGFLRRPRLSEP